MADIVNAGAIILVAAFGLVAIVGAADEFRAIAGPAPEPHATPSGLAAEPSGAPDVGTSIPGKHGLGDDRSDKRGEDDRGRDGEDDRRHDGEDDEGDDGEGHGEDDEGDD